MMSHSLELASAINRRAAWLFGLAVALGLLAWPSVARANALLPFALDPTQQQILSFDGTLTYTASTGEFQSATYPVSWSGPAGFGFAASGMISLERVQKVRLALFAGLVYVRGHDTDVLPNGLDR